MEPQVNYTIQHYAMNSIITPVTNMLLRRASMHQREKQLCKLILVAAV